MITTRKAPPVPHDAASITSAPSDDKYVPAAVHAATQSLLRVATSDQAAQVLVQLVRDLGGHTVPESLADPNALPIDISLGQGESVYPTASKGSATHWLLTTYMEAAVKDALAAIELVSAAERLATDAGIDPKSGLPDHQTMSRLLSRLEAGDAILAIDLDWIRLIGVDNHPGEEELLRLFGKALRLSTRATEYCGRFSGGEFLILLREPGSEGGTRVLERLRDRWDKVPHDELTFSAGIAVLNDEGWRPAIEAADRALKRAQESGDRWETATQSDY
jgi:diguanylate cyclase (GGDEF)-like protein